MNYCSIILLLAAVSTAQAVGNGQTTNHIKFTGLPGSFTYQRATSLQATGNGAQCSMGTVQAEGPLAPLTNEMHHIFRGPLNLKQFAVYQPKAAPVKRDTLRESPMERRGRLSHLEKHKVRNSHDHKQEKRNYGEWVTATIDGQVVSFIDNWSPHSTPITQPTSASPATITPAAAPAPIAAIQKGPVRVAAAPGPGPDNGSAKPQTLDTTDEWVRVSYFDSNSKTTDNIAFTANNNFA